MNHFFFLDILVGNIFNREKNWADACHTSYDAEKAFRIDSIFEVISSLPISQMVKFSKLYD